MRLFFLGGSYLGVQNARGSVLLFGGPPTNPMIVSRRLEDRSAQIPPLQHIQPTNNEHQTNLVLVSQEVRCKLLIHGSSGGPTKDNSTDYLRISSGSYRLG